MYDWPFTEVERNFTFYKGFDPKVLYRNKSYKNALGQMGKSRHISLYTCVWNMQVKTSIIRLVYVV